MIANFADFETKIKRNLPLAPLTTWKIGGEADYFLSVQNKQELLWILEIAKAQGLPLFILGRGSNLLIDDTGLPGLTIRLSGEFKKIEWGEDEIGVGAGKPMPALANETATKGIAGFEHLIGIPGTVGAGVTINAGKGSNGSMDMRRILKKVRYIDENLDLIETDVESLELGYRTSRLKSECALVLEAVFCTQTRDEPKRMKQTMRAILDERRVKFPLDLPNCGSVFKRPHGAPPAGWLIETAGMKGYRINVAQVSTVHANFIVNRGKASSGDVKALIDTVQENVHKVHGVLLEREVIYWPEENLWNRL